MNREIATTFATLAGLTIATFVPAVADDFAITMTGPVTRVAEGTVAEEALAQDV